jgi:hypothetical protein
VTTLGYVGAFRRRPRVRQNWGVAGGGGRTRTYEGLASGFTVRPLCHSGHSPAAAKIKSRGRKRLGRAEADRVRLMLLRGQPVNWNMPLIKWRRQGTERTLSAEDTGGARRFCDASQPAGGRGAPTGEFPNRPPPSLSMAFRPCAPCIACRRPSPRRGRRRGSLPRRQRCDRRFRDKPRPRRFR